MTTACLFISVINHIRVSAVYLSTETSGIKTHYRLMKSFLVLGKYCFRWFSSGLIVSTSVEEERLVFWLFVGFLSVVWMSEFYCWSDGGVVQVWWTPVFLSTATSISAILPQQLISSALHSVYSRSSKKPSHTLISKHKQKLSWTCLMPENKAHWSLWGCFHTFRVFSHLVLFRGLNVVRIIFGPYVNTPNDLSLLSTEYGSLSAKGTVR